MGTYLNNDAQYIYNSLKKNLGRFEDLYKDKDIQDALTELYTNSLESRIEHNTSTNVSIAEVLNNLCAMVSWVRSYCKFHDFLDSTEMEDAIKLALFNFQLGEAPQYTSIFPKGTKQYLHKAGNIDPHSVVPYLPGGKED
jgi:hypothetical protein